MDWTIIYDITREKYYWVDIELSIMVFLCFICILGEMMALRNKEESFSFIMLIKVTVCAFLIIFGISGIFSDGVSIKNGLKTDYQKALTDGNYSISSGVPKDVEWHNGAFTFELDGKNFYCDMRSSEKRRTQIQPYFAGNNMRVYFYEEKMYDEYHQEYMVLKIEVEPNAESAVK